MILGEVFLLREASSLWRRHTTGLKKRRRVLKHNTKNCCVCVCVREKCVGRLPAAVYCLSALLSVLLDAPSSSCILHLFEAASPSLTSVPSSSSVTAFFLLLHHLSLHLHSLLMSPSVHPSSIPPSLWPASSCAAAAVLFF